MQKCHSSVSNTVISLFFQKKKKKWTTTTTKQQPREARGNYKYHNKAAAAKQKEGMHDPGVVTWNSNLKRRLKGVIKKASDWWIRFDSFIPIVDDDYKYFFRRSILSIFWLDENVASRSRGAIVIDRRHINCNFVDCPRAIVNRFDLACMRAHGDAKYRWKTTIAHTLQANDRKNARINQLHRLVASRPYSFRRRQHRAMEAEAAAAASTRDININKTSTTSTLLVPVVAAATAAELY
jgi:hypothetical protein